MRKFCIAAWAVGFAALAGVFAAPVFAQSLVPATFFNTPIDPAAPTAVEAEQLVFDAATNTITANGDVVLSVGGYTLSGQSLVYNRSTRELTFRGAVRVADPAGNVSNTDNLNVAGGMKQAFLDALTIDAYDGSRITADSMDYDSALLTVLSNATYAPCGDCLDDSGKRIGWSMRASKVTYNAEDGSVELENPSLALLGIPVAWLPYLWLPDLSDSSLANVPRPSLDYSEQIGLKVEVPWMVYSSRHTDIILTPTLLSRQGFLMGAEWVQRFDHGSFRIKASGLYQMDQAAFTFPDAQRDWRGAIQSSGEFTPIEHWKTGWSYTAFTDSAYLTDYRLSDAKSTLNEVYVNHLDQATYFDARLQQYTLLNSTDISRAAEGIALPKFRFERIFTLADGAGQINVEARMLGIYRELDAPTVINGVPYTYGFAGQRYHAQTQVSWQNQIITDFGVVAMPFAGLRLDGATYDGASTLASAPPAQNLWTATPIAAMDIRYPMVASGLGAVHYVEPIAQLVYRGEQSSTPGITNEDSQSAVLNDTNLFSFNRFTGIDRQETGLRANIGLRYQAIFGEGQYVELVGGQSFHLSGNNAYAEPNPYQTGLGSGLETPTSYAVLGLYAVPVEGLKIGGKLQFDTVDSKIRRAQLGVKYRHNDGWQAALNYHYSADIPAAGIGTMHEIGAELTVPVTEYLSVTGIGDWDLAANTWLRVGGGVTYDDGYLTMGATITRNGPTHLSANDTRIMATFALKAPAGFNAGYSGTVPLPDFGGQ